MQQVNIEDRVHKLEKEYKVLYSIVNDISMSMGQVSKNVTKVDAKLSNLRTAIYVAIGCVGLYLGTFGWLINRVININDQINSNQDQTNILQDKGLYQMHIENQNQISLLWQHIRVLENKKERKK